MVEVVVGSTVHFGYKGQLGTRIFVPYIQLCLISEVLFSGSSIWELERND